jgi:hypothetical protein
MPNIAWSNECSFSVPNAQCHTDQIYVKIDRNINLTNRDSCESVDGRCTVKLDNDKDNIPVLV